MTNQRDELAREIFIADNSNQSREASIKDWETYTPGEFNYTHGIADGLLAAGWTKPRTVTEYGIVFNGYANGLTPPALSLEEFKQRYPNESYWSITDRDVYIQRTRQEVDPEPGDWELMPTDTTPDGAA